MVEERLRRRVRTLEEQLEARSREVVALRARVDELSAPTARGTGTANGARATTMRLWHALTRRAQRVIGAGRRSVS